MNLDDLEKSAWYPELRNDIENALKELIGSNSDQPSQLQRELEAIQKKKSGWKISLGDPNLPRSVRDEIHTDYDRAEAREREIKSELQRRQNHQQYQQKIFNPTLVLNGLNRLDDVLAGENATLGNLELSLHIDRIDCFDDGHVKMRVCRLGALSECVELLSTEYCANDTSPQADSSLNFAGRVKPRRRAKLRVDSIGSEAAELDATAAFVADPDRFTGLGDEWFQVFEFDVPTEKHWYQIHSLEVAQKRKEGLTHAQLSEEFGVTVPTIRKSLKYAVKKDPTLADVPRKMARSRWHEDHAHEVLKKKAEGLGTNELVDFFGKSDTTILKALRYAEENPPSKSV